MEFQNHGNQHSHIKAIVKSSIIVVPAEVEPENNSDLFGDKDERSVMFKLNYQLISLFTYQPDSETYQNIYSIAVNKIQNDDIVESEFLHDITRQEDKAIELYNLLLRNLVTPLSLREIAEEYLPI